MDYQFLVSAIQTHLSGNPIIVWFAMVTIGAYFSLGMFTHHLDNEAKVGRILFILHAEEFFFWPWHVSLVDVWKKRWNESYEYRIEMIAFVLILSFLALLFPVLSFVEYIPQRMLAFAVMWAGTGLLIYGVASKCTNNGEEVFSEYSFWIWPLVSICGPLGYRCIAKIALRNIEFMQARP